MAGIGEDISEVLAELGTPMTIIRRSGSNITGEYFDFEAYHEHSTDFIRQNCFSGTFAHNSAVVSGDIIFAYSVYYLILNIKATLFEQERVVLDSFFVECNTIGKFARWNPGTRNSKEEKVGSWDDVATDVHGLELEETGNQDVVAESAILSNSTDVLYTTEIPELRIGDRWYPDLDDLSEFYNVAKIRKRRYKGCYKITLTEDSRNG